MLLKSDKEIGSNVATVEKNSRREQQGLADDCVRLKGAFRHFWALRFLHQLKYSRSSLFILSNCIHRERISASCSVSVAYNNSHISCGLAHWSQHLSPRFTRSVDFLFLISFSQRIQPSVLMTSLAHSPPSSCPLLFLITLIPSHSFIYAWFPWSALLLSLLSSIFISPTQVASWLHLISVCVPHSLETSYFKIVKSVSLLRSQLNFSLLTFFIIAGKQMKLSKIISGTGAWKSDMKVALSLSLPWQVFSNILSNSWTHTIGLLYLLWERFT